jgi:Integrase core domain
VASKSAGVGDHGNQNRTTRATIASIRERLIGTIRRQFLDQTLFWTAADLEEKLVDFQHYFNEHRTHSGLDGRTPETWNVVGRAVANLNSYGWRAIVEGCFKRRLPPNC